MVFADDQLVNREAIRIKMEHLGINDRVSIFSDGQETVQHIERVVNSIEFNCLDLDSINASDTAVQPISLLLLDINMPMLNGFQVQTQVKSMFAQVE